MSKGTVRNADKVLEMLWLNYYNDTLYSRGLITKFGYFMMRKLIMERSSK